MTPRLVASVSRHVLPFLAPFVPGWPALPSLSLFLQPGPALEASISLGLSLHKFLSPCPPPPPPPPPPLAILHLPWKSGEAARGWRAPGTRGRRQRWQLRETKTCAHNCRVALGAEGPVPPAFTFQVFPAWLRSTFPLAARQAALPWPPPCTGRPAAPWGLCRAPHPPLPIPSLTASASGVFPPTPAPPAPSGGMGRWKGGFRSFRGGPHCLDHRGGVYVPFAHELSTTQRAKVMGSRAHSRLAELGQWCGGWQTGVEGMEKAKVSQFRS